MSAPDRPASKLPVKLKFTVKPKTPAVETSSQSDPSQSYFSQSNPPPSNPSQSTPPSDAPAAPKPRLSLTTKPATKAPKPQQIKPKKSKAGRPAKPSSKLLESRKRKDEDTASEDEDGATINVQPPKKKHKLSFKLGAPKTPVPKTPASATPGPGTGVVIKAKVKGKPPKRNLGEGYDSEASDREIDPTIEEEFILRMVPGDDCDYLRHAVDKKLIGTGKQNADIQMKFFHESGRRAAVTIRGRVYAATLVDLPCIIEGLKSWDKRGFVKSADICQMLWVFAPVASEAEAKTVALPSIIDPNNYQYPHGLTAPLHNVRKRRFRKRLHKDEIEKVENEVERLLKADAEAVSSKYTVYDPDLESRRASQPYSRDGSTPARYGVGQDYSDDEEEEEDDNEDADGEVDDGYFANQPGQSNNNVEQNIEVDADDLEADLEAAMEADMEVDFEAETPMSQMAPTPSAMPNGEVAAEAEDSGDDSGEDDDDDGMDGSSDIDDDERERLIQVQGIKEDIAELEQNVATQQANLAQQTNLILRRRIEDTIRKVKQEIQLKKSSIGEGEENQ